MLEVKNAKAGPAMIAPADAPRSRGATSRPAIRFGPPYGLGRSLSALGILLVIAIINYVDRVTFHVLQVPIKADFNLSDTQLGILTGTAFSLPYILFSIPMGRIADYVNRKYMLMTALAIWSGMTAALGLANGFGTLVVLRMGVAMGEACCLPIIYSLIGDYFTSEKRSRAIAVLGTATPIGSMIGLSAGGLLSDSLGWQAAFLILGGLSLSMVPVTALFFREPARSDAKGRIVTAKPPGLRRSITLLWQLKSVRYGAIGAGFQALTSLTILHWSAPFYGRSYHLNISEIGVMLGVMLGLAGGVGALAGGFVVDKLGIRDRRWMMWVPTITCFLTIPFALVQFLTGSLSVSIAAGVLVASMMSVYVPAVHATAQLLVPSNLRALTSAVIITLTSVVGSAFGGAAVGFLSDIFATRFEFGEEALRGAICVSLTASLVAGFCFWRASKFVAAEARQAQLDIDAEGCR